MPNWKTSLAGVASFLIGGCIYQGWLTPESGAALIAALTGLGLFAAKDA
jgi:hypothetical protein